MTTTLILIFALASAVIATTAWSVSSSSALPSISSLNDAPMPTHAQFHAYAEIAKPTNTEIPTQIPTSTAEPLANSNVIVDTSSPEYAASVIEQPFDQSDPAGMNYSGNKHILIDISEQHMYVYEGDTLVYSFVSSTGMNNSTSVGSFSVLNKIPNAYGATWDIWMPNWLGIYWAGSLQNGIHALPILPNGAQLWEGFLGTPISYGCIVLGTEESQLLYDWAEIGTPVEIQW